MLAPINAPTGDGRRFRQGGITLAETPFPLEWARAREGGHDGAVVVGAIQEAEIATVEEALANEWVSQEAVKSMGLAKDAEAIWARGELFDDVSRLEMPRLAEDVAEAMHLISAGTLGPSVDLDSFEGIPVRAGSEEEVTWEMLEEAELAGEELKIELLVTEGRVRAATLVSIPAFAETSRPLELISEEALTASEGETAPTEAERAERLAALIASVTAPPRPPAAAFDMPALAGPTPITFDWETGRVFGHIATWGTCHLGYADMCVTPPRDPNGYAWFNRFPVDTEDGGTVWAGRLTVGGRHPGLNLTASATMAQYDTKTTAAHVRAYEDQFGIVISGVIAPDLDDSARAVLGRRKVSGDWRETPEGLSLVEVLALSPGPRVHSEPGFPVATHVVNGRQVALTAALGPDPDAAPRVVKVDVGAAVRLELARRDAAAELAALLDQDRARERAALAAALGSTIDGEEG